MGIFRSTPADDLTKARDRAERLRGSVTRAEEGLARAEDRVRTCERDLSAAVLHGGAEDAARDLLVAKEVRDASSAALASARGALETATAEVARLEEAQRKREHAEAAAAAREVAKSASREVDEAAAALVDAIAKEAAAMERASVAADAAGEPLGIALADLLNLGTRLEERRMYQGLAVARGLGLR